MNSPVDLLSCSLKYLFHVTVVSLAGSFPPTFYFFLLLLSSPNATLIGVLLPTLIAGVFCLLFVVFPFCFIVAVPLALIINHSIKLNLARTLLLALVLTAPGIIFLDYRNYSSSGPDSGPPTEPYSLSHLMRSITSPSDFFLMVIIPMTSALLCASALWYLRFRKKT